MQSSLNLIRLGGIAAALGGLAFAAKAYWDRNDAPPWPGDATDTFAFVIPLLFLIGVSGLYALCRGRLGGLGTAGFMVSLAGLAASTVGSIGVRSVDGFWFAFVLGMLIGLLGLALAGIAILRARLLGAWSVLPLVLAVYSLFALMTGDPANSAFGRTAGLALWMLLGAGWVLLGYVLLSAASEESVESRPALGS